MSRPAGVRRSWRRAAAGVWVVVLAVAAVLLAPPAAAQPAQVELPFTGLIFPVGVAVSGGKVYVADTGNGRVLVLNEGRGGLICLGS